MDGDRETEEIDAELEEALQDNEEHIKSQVLAKLRKKQRKIDKMIDYIEGAETQSRVSRSKSPDSIAVKNS